MLPQFELPTGQHRELSSLDSCRFRGDFRGALRLVQKVLAGTPQPNYDPVNSALLLKLHCAAAAAHDHIGSYEEAQEFVLPWAAEIQFAVTRFLNGQSERSPVQELTSNGTEIGEGVEPPWLERSWLLERCGVACYRMNKFNSAREYLDDAITLTGVVLQRAAIRRNQGLATFSELRALEEASTYAHKYYWRGCVNTYSNRFHEAEQDFLMALQLIANELPGSASAMHNSKRHGSGSDELSRPVSSRMSEDRDELVECVRFAYYVTARLLMGLGLLKFHQGSLYDARSHLLTARILFSKGTTDAARELRTKLLLLSIDRLYNQKNKSALTRILGELERLALTLAPTDAPVHSSDARHPRYYARTKWTIGLVNMNLADLIQETTSEATKDRTAALDRAWDIACDSNLRVYGNAGDRLQMEILKLRVLRKKAQYDVEDKVSQYQKALAWGEAILNRPAMRDHPLLYVEALVAQGHTALAFSRDGGDRKYLRDARDMISEAAKASENNPRSQAICNLYLADIWHDLGRKDHAESHFAAWNRLAKLVEVPWIKERSDEVRAQLDGSKESFVVSPSVLPGKTYATLDKELRKFLLKSVTHGLTTEDASARLGISRQTLYTWRRELEEKPTAEGEP